MIKMFRYRVQCYSLIMGMSLFTFIFGCSASETNNLADERQSLKEYFGLILKNGQPVCTAFKSGRNEISAPGNCFSDEQRLFVFQDSTRKRYPIRGVSSFNTKNDVAVLKVDIGDKHIGRNTLKQKVSTSFAWVDPKTNELQMNGSGQFFVDSGAVFHTFKVEKTGLGGVLIQNGSAVAMHVGYLSKSVFNVAVPFLSIGELDLRSIDSTKVNIPRLKWPKIKIGGDVGKALGTITNPIKEYAWDPYWHKIHIPLGNWADLQVHNFASEISKFTGIDIEAIMCVLNIAEFDHDTNLCLTSVAAAAEMPEITWASVVICMRASQSYDRAEKQCLRGYKEVPYVPSGGNNSHKCTDPFCPKKPDSLQ